MSQKSEADIAYVLTEVSQAADTIALLYQEHLVEKIADVAYEVAGRVLAGGKILIIGNGGSAADAQHIAAEFLCRLNKNRNPIPAIALTTDTSTLTAIGNDLGYHNVFERQVKALMGPKDVLIAISTSGNSPNILNALAVCTGMSVLLTGGNGGHAAHDADHVILAPSTETPHIQECHTVIYHVLCGLIEKKLVEWGFCVYE
jgi:D-sedoheptulose 7-phosphate isomerase